MHRMCPRAPLTLTTWQVDIDLRRIKLLAKRYLEHASSMSQTNHLRKTKNERTLRHASHRGLPRAQTPPLKEQESDSEREEDEEAMRGDGEQSGKGVGSLDFGDLPWLSDVEIAAMREEMEAGANVREEYDHDDEELLERELRSKLATLQVRFTLSKLLFRWSSVAKQPEPGNVALWGHSR